jgi:hypothetical protein
METRGHVVFPPTVKPLQEEDPIVFELISKGEKYYESKSIDVANESLSYCKDAYKNRLSTQCYFKPTDKRTIKSCALEDAQSRGKGIPVISRHVSERGTRRYYVTSWPNFVEELYPKIKGSNKSFYENIYLNDACRPYVDIDLDIGDVVPFVDDDNDDDDGTLSSIQRAAFVEYTDALHEHVMKMAISLKNLIELAFAHANVKVTDIFVLDSSAFWTKKRKFSHHLIFHLDNDTTRFESSADLLNLFDYVRKTSFLCEQNGIDQTENPFFWPSHIKRSVLRSVLRFDDSEMDVAKTDREEKDELLYVPLKNRSFVADLSVFGNTSREFRIVGSTKYGEERHFKLIRHCQFENESVGPGFRNFDDASSDFQIFSKLLVCFVEENVPVTKLLTFDIVSERGLNVLLANLENSKNASSKPAANGSNGVDSSKRRSICCDAVIFDDFCGIADMKEDYEKFPKAMKKLFDCFSNEKHREYVFEVVAADILRQNPQLEGERVEWTKYVARDGSYAVSYKTSSKYCEIKGDEHNNNHVFYVVWLKSKCYYQRCWNLACCQSRIEASYERRNATVAKAEKKGTNQDGDGDGDGDIDDAGNERDETDRRGYEGNEYIRTCKATTRQLSTDTWQLIQDFLHVQITMVETYKKFKAGGLDDEIRTAAIEDYEALEDIDLNEEEEENDDATMQTDYSVERFKTDPIFDDLFPKNESARSSISRF